MSLKDGEDWPKNGAISITTPCVTHMHAEQYLSELVMINRYGLDKLEKYFWRQEKYKKVYVLYLFLLRKRLKEISFKILNSVIITDKVSELNYGFDEKILKFLKEYEE